MTASEKCPSVHKWSDLRCIREKGHEGRCWSKSVRNRTSGTITRAEWHSVNGVFKSHYRYDTKYPTNSTKGANDE